MLLTGDVDGRWNCCNIDVTYGEVDGLEELSLEHKSVLVSSANPHSEAGSPRLLFRQSPSFDLTEFVFTELSRGNVADRDGLCTSGRSSLVVSRTSRLELEPTVFGRARLPNEGKHPPVWLSLFLKGDDCSR